MLSSLKSGINLVLLSFNKEIVKLGQNGDKKYNGSFWIEKRIEDDLTFWSDLDSCVVRI